MRSARGACRRSRATPQCSRPATRPAAWRFLTGAPHEAVDPPFRGPGGVVAMARLGAAARNDLGAQRTEPGAPAGRPRAGRPGGNRMGLAATRMGTLPRADGWAAGYLLAQPGPAVRPGHRSSHGRRTAPLCGTAGAGGSAPRREAARLPARLRRGLAAPESGDAAREPARRQAGRRPIQQSLARQRPHGGVRQGRLRSLRTARAAPAILGRGVRPVHGGQPPG